MMSGSSSSKNKGTQAKVTPKVIEINEASLPLCCPRPEDVLWNQHPRVVLPIVRGQTVQCYYCGMTYHWPDDQKTQVED